VARRRNGRGPNPGDREGALSPLGPLKYEHPSDDELPIWRQTLFGFLIGLGLLALGLVAIWFHRPGYALTAVPGGILLVVVGVGFWVLAVVNIFYVLRKRRSSSEK
jgi:hypothetical protein